MVFMKDSQRAAESAIAAGLETGLHLNLDLFFDKSGLPPRLREYHDPVVRFLRRGKWAQLLYNPFLRKKFAYVFNAQYDEYCRLYGREPAKIDGHHHMHLCMNIIIDHIIPSGLRIRRNSSFVPGEKGIINRSYRRLLDILLIRRYCCTDWFFNIEPINDSNRLERVVRLASSSNVELVVHPAKTEQYVYLKSSYYRDLIAAVAKGTYSILSNLF